MSIYGTFHFEKVGTNTFFLYFEGDLIDSDAKIYIREDYLKNESDFYYICKIGECASLAIDGIYTINLNSRNRNI